jgi:hypothetical protein
VVTHLSPFAQTVPSSSSRSTSRLPKPRLDQPGLVTKRDRPSRASAESRRPVGRYASTASFALIPGGSAILGKVATEVVSHLSSLPGTEVGVIVEIAARNDEGFPEAARNLSENAKTLKFDNFGFEER